MNRYWSLALVVMGAPAFAQRGAGFITDPTLPEDAITRVSDHVYAILGFPNVGIIGDVRLLQEQRQRILPP